mmetsp:Transcript_21647/g.50602  ORF Transcript_21647/g.50602 Transcript_21647/m.50602 type:complete len:297 (-) Transcript_21647:17-907(-)
MAEYAKGHPAGPAAGATLSVHLELSVSDSEVAGGEPGPGHYFGPNSPGFTSMGRQAQSKSFSSPSISLSRTGWDDLKVVRISKGHDKGQVGRDSPGLVYGSPPSTLQGKGTRFGSSTRPDLSRALGVDPLGSPGPAYNVRAASAIGGYAHPQDKSFGRADRFRLTSETGTIGPGQYRRKDVALRMDMGRSFGIGRAAYEKVCSPGWETVGQGQASAGVGEPLWFDPLKKSGLRAGSTTFGKQERFASPASQGDTPGPGQYNQALPLCTRSTSIMGSCLAGARSAKNSPGRSGRKGK